MSDQNLYLNQNTKEEVAFKLMLKIAQTEKIYTKDALLDLYVECLEAVKGLRPSPEVRE
ncbi:hypothetical protein [Vibrio cholerae]|uniref:hypothetical protein n=2 Tax=Vibrio cholerae TaxID=666 RepID=UPI00163BEAC0|nr:hypothetical protein [Vibrio cholerae]